MWQAYVYRSGFARFTIAHFSIKKEDIVNNLVHLTNFSIQKHAPTFKSKTGTKWLALPCVTFFVLYQQPVTPCINCGLHHSNHRLPWSIIEVLAYYCLISMTKRHCHSIRSLHSLKMHMISKHGEQDVNGLFHNIHMLISRSLLAVQNVIIQDKHCFELYGYDILVDDTLKPWLLEVSARSVLQF